MNPMTMSKPRFDAMTDEDVARVGRFLSNADLRKLARVHGYSLTEDGVYVARRRRGLLLQEMADS